MLWTVDEAHNMALKEKLMECTVNRFGITDGMPLNHLKEEISRNQGPLVVNRLRIEELVVGLG